MSAAPAPAWFEALLGSGEALALLSLCGNTALQHDDTAGTSVSYTPRSAATVPLVNGPFEYEVLDVCNGADGAEAPTGATSLSRGLILRPKHQTDTVCIVFRGARPDAVVPGRSAWPGFEADRDCMLAYERAIDMRYTGSKGLAHSGVAQYERVLCQTHADDDMLIKRGLIHRLRLHVNTATPPSRIILAGLSLGGSLAQAVALRITEAIPSLRAHVHVLAFAPLAWTTDPLSAYFEDTFSSRAVTMINCERRDGVPPPNATWTTRLPLAGGVPPPPSSSSATSHSIATKPARLTRRVSREPPTPIVAASSTSSSPPSPITEQHLVVDPALSFFQTESMPHRLRQPRVAICVYEMARGKHAATSAANAADHGGASLLCGFSPAYLDATAAAHVTPLTLDPPLLYDLLYHRLRDGHHLEADYTLLHMGRAYRETLLSLFLQHRAHASPRAATRMNAAEPNRMPPPPKALSDSADEPYQQRQAKRRADAIDDPVAAPPLHVSQPCHTSTSTSLAGSNPLSADSSFPALPISAGQSRPHSSSDVSTSSPTGSAPPPLHAGGPSSTGSSNGTRPFVRSGDEGEALSKRQRSIDRALCELETTGDLTSRAGNPAIDLLGLAVDGASGHAQGDSAEVNRDGGGMRRNDGSYGDFSMF